MRSAAITLALLAAGARAGDDPPGTVPLRIEAGETAPIEAPPGTNILCDDPRVVAPEFAPDGNSFLLRAGEPGETLCGVWLGEAKPGGLYRVTVAARPRGEDAGAPPHAAGGGDPAARGAIDAGDAAGADGGGAGGSGAIDAGAPR